MAKYGICEEGAEKIAAFVGKVSGLIKIGSIYIKPSTDGTLGSLGAEGKLGVRGIRAGLHAIIGFSVGIEWGYVDQLQCE